MQKESLQLETEISKQNTNDWDKYLLFCPCGCLIGIIFISIAFLIIGLSIATGIFNVNPFKPGGSGNGQLSESCQELANINPEMIKAVNAAAAKYGIDAALVAATIQQESGWNQNSISPVGARGLMQVMPETWDGIDHNSSGDATDGDRDGKKDPYGIWDGIFAGTYYMKELKDQFGDNLEKRIAAYNAGPGAVQEHNGIPPYPETINYVQIVLKNYEDYKKCLTYSNSGQAVEWCWPTNTQNISPGASFHDPNYPFGIHEGIDVAPQPGQWNEYDVSAVKDGTVVEILDGCESGTTGGNINCGSKYGNHIIIDHGNGQTSTYAHLKKDTIEVKKGDRVSKRQNIARINSSGFSSGDHLHFEIRFDGIAQDPQNLLQQCIGIATSCGEKGQKAVEFALHQIGKDYSQGDNGSNIGGWDSQTFDCAGLFGSAWYYATGNARYYHSRVGTFESFGDAKVFHPTGNITDELQPGDGVYGGTYYGTESANTDFGHMGIYVGQVTYDGKTYQHAVVEAKGRDYGVIIREFEEGSWSRNIYSRVIDCVI